MDTTDIELQAKIDRMRESHGRGPQAVFRSARKAEAPSP